MSDIRETSPELRDARPGDIAPGAAVVGGAPEGLDAQLVARLVARAARPVIHVARDDARAAAMAEALGIFAPELPVLSFPAWDCLPYDRVSRAASAAVQSASAR